jgi:hypothetical protein
METWVWLVGAFILGGLLLALHRSGASRKTRDLESLSELQKVKSRQSQRLEGRDHDSPPVRAPGTLPSTVPLLRAPTMRTRVGAQGLRVSHREALLRRYQPRATVPAEERSFSSARQRAPLPIKARTDTLPPNLLSVGEVEMRIQYPFLPIWEAEVSAQVKQLLEGEGDPVQARNDLLGLRSLLEGVLYNPWGWETNAGAQPLAGRVWNRPACQEVLRKVGFVKSRGSQRISVPRVTAAHLEVMRAAIREVDRLRTSVR